MPDQVIDQPNHARRFAGVAQLYGDAGLARLRDSHICVIGIGGVGSWAAESLARSAIGTLTLIDMDVVMESNINRQILADSQSLGRNKVDVMQERINNINPSCRVHLIDDFINKDNLSRMLCHDHNYVIDCIDDFRIKAALIAHCKRQKIKVLTVGGAGGQMDPRKIQQVDLSRTQHDTLLARTRKLLRQDYGFARNTKRSFGVPCVYSDEQAVYADGRGGLSPQRPLQDISQGVTNNALNCAGGMGSITHVTATFAFFATAHVLTELASC